MFFGVLVALNGIATNTTIRDTQATLTADVGATNFLAYRTAVVDYLNANPTAIQGNGTTIADASLTFLPGYIRDAAWSNYIYGNTIYIYGASRNRLLDTVYDKTGDSLNVGTKNTVSSVAYFNQAKGLTSAQALPAAVGAVIPDGNVVMIGK